MPSFLRSGHRQPRRNQIALAAGLAFLALQPVLLLAQGADSTRARRRIQPFPALGSAPETGLQLGATVLAVVQPAPMHHARPASLVASAIRSVEGQTRLSLEGEHWTAGNARRLQAQLAWQKFPLPFYGVGGNAPESARETFTPVGVEANATWQQRIRGAWYSVAGARFIDQSITAESAGSALATDAALVGATGGRVVESTVGVLRDSRDFVFNPSSGSLATLTASVSDAALGSEFGYRRLRLDARRYQSLSRGHIVAAHVLVIGTDGAAPFDQLALVGSGDILRGYARGRYRDAWLSAAQLEYRTPIRHRVGAVLFGGAGTVAAEARLLRSGPLLPTYGAGLRVQIDEKQRTAVRVDHGRGRDGATGLYIGFNQAF
jgi:hypothetical protein